MITILIVDDHGLVREGIAKLLGDVSGLKIIGQAENGEDAVEIAKKQKPQVVLMDVKMPGIGGLEATKKMVRHNKEIKVIILTVCDDEPFPSKLLQAGASGYITKNSDIAEIITAIRTVASGTRYIGPQIAQRMALGSVSGEENKIDSLSDRELQVMLMIIAGQKVQDISDKLCLSPKTVNSYRYRLFDKLAVESDVELTLLAMRHGMLEGVAQT
ncbi:MAG: two-component system response regulator UvrY [Legionellales bacterium]|nr:MAG: two-component system response regulator UvrY [Legionellales bacterium]